MKKITIIIFLLAFYSLAQAQDMKGMEMNKKETKQQPVTYTCPMHPEIHSSKPGNCPKCGMKLVKEKPKPVKKQPMQKHDDMQMHKDTAKKKDMDMGNMNMDKMNMKDTAKDKMMDMGDMQ